MSRNSLNSSVPSPADSFPSAYRVSRSPSEDSKVSLAQVRSSTALQGPATGAGTVP